MTDDTTPSLHELLLHPLRFRILRLLAAERLTTRQIAEQLADAPTSSVYRHLRLLLEAGLIVVVDTQLVKAIQEKRYTLAAEPPAAETDELAAFALALLRGRDAVPPALEEAPPVLVGRPGYTELSVWASKEEMNRFLTELNSALRPLKVNGPAAGRSRHTIAFVTQPDR